MRDLKFTLKILSIEVSKEATWVLRRFPSPMLREIYSHSRKFLSCLISIEKSTCSTFIFQFKLHVTVADSEEVHPARANSKIVKIKLIHTPSGKENKQLASLNYEFYVYLFSPQQAFAI